MTKEITESLEEGFDLAFRVGRLADSTLVATRIAPARLVYCASPGYLYTHGAPCSPDELSEHAIIEHTPRGGGSRWPFVSPEGELIGRCRPVWNMPHGVWGTPDGSILCTEMSPSCLTRLTRVD